MSTAAYRLEYSINEFLDTVNTTFQHLTSGSPDLYLVSSEGHKIYTQKFLLRFYNSCVSETMDYNKDDIVGLSVDASSKSIIGLLKILTSGLVTSSAREELIELMEVARLFGINLENWQIGSRKTKNQPKSRGLKTKNPNDQQKTVLPPSSKKMVSEDGKTCAICGSVFRGKWKVERHARSHYNSLKNDEECEVCHLSFKNDSQLFNHMTLLHNEDESDDHVKDEEANGDFKPEGEDCSLNESSLPEPKVKIQILACDQCDKTFATPYHLKRHQVTHTGIKFECQRCDSKFSRKDKLNKHIRDKHVEDTVTEAINQEKDKTETSNSREEDDNQIDYEDVEEDDVEINEDTEVDDN